MKPRRPVTEILADNISRLRTRAGYSQEQFAERCGIHPNTLTRVECGSHNTTTTTLDKIATTIGVHLAYLLEDHK